MRDTRAVGFVGGYAGGEPLTGGRDLLKDLVPELAPGLKLEDSGQPHYAAAVRRQPPGLAAQPCPASSSIPSLVDEEYFFGSPYLSMGLQRFHEVKFMK